MGIGQAAIYLGKNDKCMVNTFDDEIYKFKMEGEWFYEEKENCGNGGEKNILNENAEPVRQHKICFKQDIKQE